MWRRISRKIWRKKKQSFTAKSSRLKICRKPNKCWLIVLKKWKPVLNQKSNRLSLLKSNFSILKRSLKYRLRKLKISQFKLIKEPNVIRNYNKNYLMRKLEHVLMKRLSAILWVRLTQSSRRKTKSNISKVWCTYTISLSNHFQMKYNNKNRKTQKLLKSSTANSNIWRRQ